jgi:hypothetical protein
VGRFGIRMRKSNARMRGKHDKNVEVERETRRGVMDHLGPGLESVQFRGTEKPRSILAETVNELTLWYILSITCFNRIQISETIGLYLALYNVENSRLCQIGPAEPHPKDCGI